MFIYYVPGTCLSSILGVEPSKTRPFSIKIRVMWVLGGHLFKNHLPLKSSERCRFSEGEDKLTVCPCHRFPS